MSTYDYGGRSLLLIARWWCVVVVGREVVVGGCVLVAMVIIHLTFRIKKLCGVRIETSRSVGRYESIFCCCLLN